jgi:D-psicose/D-tagatose/L-ribulose 3-epimerase
MFRTSQIRLVVAVVAVVSLTAGLAPAPSSAQALRLRYGVAAFGEVDPLKSADVLSACGADYIEPALSKAVALQPAALDEALKRVAGGRARIETANWFMPGADIALTGPAVDKARIAAYLEQSLALASRLGVKVIVFGSPGARSYPAGFPPETAWTQLRDFLRQAGDAIVAGSHDLVIGIEPLRKPESNIINTVAEAARLARDVNHPKIRIIVDFYHLAFENENPDAILAAKDLIVHLQIADPKQRGFPVQEDDARYKRFFENLRTIGYDGRISIEANSSDVAADCKPALAFLRQMAARYGG